MPVQMMDSSPRSVQGTVNACRQCWSNLLEIDKDTGTYLDQHAANAEQFLDGESLDHEWFSIPRMRCAHRYAAIHWLETHHTVPVSISLFSH
jgi:hypothetical protein